MTPTEQLLSSLPEAVRAEFLRFPPEVLYEAGELRIRADKPCTVTFRGRQHTADGGLPVPQALLAASIASLCGYSVHSFSDTINEGYFTVAGGHRVGLCGSRNTFGKVDIRSASSVNIRVAREVRGCALPVLRQMQARGNTSLLLFGPPGCGKTTVLRDLVRLLASPPTLRGCAVIDERGEIAALYGGSSPFDLGVTCDVLDRWPRALGFDAALRTLSPQTIFCDEIGLDEDRAAFCDCAKSGVSVIATAHAASADELLARRNLRDMLEAGVFGAAVRLQMENGEVRIREYDKVG